MHTFSNVISAISNWNLLQDLSQHLNVYILRISLLINDRLTVSLSVCLSLSLSIYIYIVGKFYEYIYIYIYIYTHTLPIKSIWPHSKCLFLILKESFQRKKLSVKHEHVFIYYTKYKSSRSTLKMKPKYLKTIPRHLIYQNGFFFHRCHCF